jgi:hypothetical protein
MKTPTPRTDAAWAASFSPEKPSFSVLDIARTLERELATEREEAERYRLTTLKLDAELTAERARLERITTALTDAISTYFGADKLVTAERIEAWQAALKEGVK